MEFSGQEYWSGLSFPSPRDLFYTLYQDCLPVNPNLPTHPTPPFPLWYPHICSPRLCLYFCFANKIVCLFHFSRFHILLEGLKKGTPKVLEQPLRVEDCRDRHRSHYVYVTAEEANQESDMSEVIKLVRHRVGRRTPKDFKATGDRRKLLPWEFSGLSPWGFIAWYPWRQGLVSVSFLDWDQQELWEDPASEWSGLTPVWPGRMSGSRLNPTQAHKGSQRKVSAWWIPSTGSHSRDPGIWAGSNPMCGCQTRVSLAQGLGSTESPHWTFETDNSIKIGK